MHSPKQHFLSSPFLLRHPSPTACPMGPSLPSRVPGCPPAWRETWTGTLLSTKPQAPNLSLGGSGGTRLSAHMLRGWWRRGRGGGCCSPSAPTQAPSPNLSLFCPQAESAPVSPLLFLNDKEGCSPIGWNPPQTVWRRLGGKRPHCACSPGWGVNTANTEGPGASGASAHTPGSAAHRGDGGALHRPCRALAGRQIKGHRPIHRQLKIVWVFPYALMEKPNFFGQVTM